MKKLFSITIILSMVISMALPIGTFAAKDLTKVTFEKKNEDWSAFSATGEELNTIVDTGYSEGKKSIRMFDDSTELTAGIKTDRVEVEEGKTYTALCDLYLESGKMTVYLRFYNAGGKQLESLSGTGKAGQWVNVAVTGVAPEGACDADLIIASAKATKAIAYADNLKIVEGEVAAGAVTGAKVPPKYVEPELKAKDDGVKDGTLLYQTSFEKGLDDWAYRSSTAENYVAEVKDKASDGKKSIHINDSANDAGPGIGSPKLAVSEGNTYTVVADILGLSGTIKEYCFFYDEADKSVGSVSIAVPMNGSWGPYAYKVTAPRGAVSMEVAFVGIKASLGELYVDNVKVYKGTVKVQVPETEYMEPKQVPAVSAKLVAPVDNKLQYMEYNEQGDKLADYSYGGFYNGLYELPETKNLSVVATLSPSGTQDDTKMIQEAIDKAYDEAANDFFKVVKLKAGKYYINKDGIKLKSGIILSGEGQGPTGTELYTFEATSGTAVTFSGQAPKKTSDPYNITDDYVKSGSDKINLSEEDVKNFEVGDLIQVYHPSTKKWVEAMRMINMKSSSGGDNSWGEGGVDVKFERTITAINGTEITLDFATYIPLNKEYSQSYIYKLDTTDRVKNAGIENLRIVSCYNGDPQDAKHLYNGVAFGNAENCFARDVSVKHFVYSAFTCGTAAKQITVQNCSALAPIGPYGSYRYNFAASSPAQQILYTGGYSYDGRHDLECSTTVTGPIVFRDTIIDNSRNSSETHGTWSTGVLFDNVYQVPSDSQGFFSFANRGIYGTTKSQGWTTGGSVMWNTLSHLSTVHKPPMTYQNFAVGVWGVYTDETSKNLKEAKINRYKINYRTTDYYTVQDFHYATKDESSLAGDAYKEAELTPVEPRSLYKAQLAERITGNIQNARPNAPVLVYPRPEKETDDKNVAVTGVYQLGAEKVTIYIDDVAYDATMDASNCSFEVKKELAEGVHKIYATQTINGYEGNKTADRFITIGKAGTDNPSYLQSIYDSSKTRMLINDPRPTFDVYQKELEKQIVEKITVKVNGATLKSDVEPYETNGRVLVPMRAIFEALSAEVSWDEATATATATLNDTEVKITENSTTSYVNGNAVTLDVPATITNGRFVVPVRFISESFGAKVDWLDAKKTVVIEGSKFRFVPIGLDKELKIVAVRQSDGDSAGSFIEGTIDGDPNTAWAMAYDSNKPDAGYGVYDLGSSKEITAIHIALAKGDKRATTIDFYVSEDDVTYTPAKIGFVSSGTTVNLEEVVLNAKGRYVKLVSKGNTSNQWMNITNIAFIGK